MAAPQSDEIEITLLGRGFGESIVLHIGDGDWVVIDSLLDKSKNSAPREYLESLGVAPERVKVVVATHWHDDHVGGISKLYAWASSAKLVMPVVKTFRELATFISAQQPSGAAAVTNGVSELRQLVATIKAEGRAKAVHCQADLTIHRKASADLGCEVVLYALSPLAADLDLFITRLGEAATSGNLAKRLQPFAPNDVSVAALLTLGDDAVLLGADLEVTAEPERGWRAVLASDTRPPIRASAYKIAHHGSENADCDELWSELLTASPVSVLSPFNKGKGLPTQVQVTRILTKSKNAHVTNITPFRKYRDKGTMTKAAIEAANLNLRPGHREVGRVTLRKRLPDPDWAISYEGGASDLSRFVARG